LTETVRYLKERKQFNRPVGGFQALKHRLAHLWQEVVGTRAAARNAADALAAGSPDTDVAVAVAQAYAAPVAVHAAEEAVQLHGGLGMTWEHPVHLYLKRAKADSIAYGTAGAHREALAGLVTSRPPDHRHPRHEGPLPSPAKRRTGAGLRPADRVLLERWCDRTVGWAELTSV
jgi:alkylation response protein AidB-like acyl-CoA dehydrogenase